jgi:glycosyltransferase involved in cell wall biosynthesis
MLKDRHIICFAHDWGGDPTSKTHIMRILARRGNRVLWVNSVAMRRPTASGRDLRRLATKLRRAFDGCVEVEPNLFVVNPLVLPLPGVTLADRLNAAILGRHLRRLCARHGLDRPILWTFLPNVNRLVGRLGERMLVYHCVDEYSAFVGVPREDLIRMERDLVRRADLVVTSSEQLCRERLALNPNTHFVSHGVDIEHFAAAQDPSTPIPRDLRGLPRPVVGFFGLIAEWVDLDVVRAVATAHPDWSVVLIGRATRSLAAVTGLQNVHLLGQRPYAVLPAYCRGFDVGIIPFRLNELTVRANPLKLREYLAAGLPVVATDLPEIRRYAHLVKLASGPASFVRAVEATLRDTDPSRTRARQDAMRGESWSARVEDVSALIEGSAVLQP